MSDLRAALVAAELASELFIAGDGFPATAIHTNEESADLAVAVVEPLLAAAEARGAIAALRDMADRIDRGPRFNMPPSVISALVRERADDLGAEATKETDR